MLQGQDVFYDPLHHRHHPSAPNLRVELTRTVEFQNIRTHIHTSYSPLPQPASLPPPDPVIPPPTPTHYSLTTYLLPRSGPPPVLSSSHSHSLPAGQLSVDVKVGSVVSNSPSDTGLLTFCCTLRKEGFFSLLTDITPHRS